MKNQIIEHFVKFSDISNSKSFIEWIFKSAEYALVLGVFMYLSEITGSLSIKITSIILATTLLAHILTGLPLHILKKENRNTADAISYVLIFAFLFLLVEGLLDVVDLYKNGRGI